MNKGTPKFSINGVSKKFKLKCQTYLIFADPWKHCLDFSDDMMIELFNSESFGTSVSSKNGYFHGKKWMDVTIAMWREDISNGHLCRSELYEDPKYDHDWLNSVLP